MRRPAFFVVRDGFAARLRGNDVLDCGPLRPRGRGLAGSIPALRSRPTLPGGNEKARRRPPGQAFSLNQPLGGATLEAPPPM